MAVVKFYPKDAAKNPDCVLEQAEGVYCEVLVIGYDEDGEIDVRSSSGIANGPDLLWLLEAVKFKLMRGDYAPDNPDQTGDP